MDLFSGAERLMRMDDATWARHANPWSGWSRFSVLPLLALAVWSRVWLGWWALVPVACALGWTWLNPRLFAPPATDRAWPTRAVLGERVFLQRRADVAPHHRRAAIVLTWASVPGMLILSAGLWLLWWEGAVFGTVLTMLPKIWFCDRMVWLREEWIRSGGGAPAFLPGRQGA